MSQPDLADQAEPVVETQEPTLQAPRPAAEVPRQKQKTNVYTVMLIVSFICLVVACILLWAELNRWGSFPGRPWDTSEGKPNIQSHYAPPAWSPTERALV